MSFWLTDVITRCYRCGIRNERRIERQRAGGAYPCGVCKAYIYFPHVPERLIAQIDSDLNVRQWWRKGGRK